MLKTLKGKFVTNLEKVILNLFTRLSVCMVIMGRRNTGKTDFSLLVAEICAKFGIIEHFASNIKIYDAPFKITHITNLEDLEFWAKTLKGKKLMILDEAGKVIRRRTPMTGLNIKILDNLQILRKYKLSLILIAPADKYLDNAVLGTDVLDAGFIKPKHNNRKVGVYKDFLDDFSVTFYGIPKTKVKFDTWDVALFTKDSPDKKPHFKDVELQKLWEWANGANIKNLGWHRSQFHRILRKFVKESLKKDVPRTQQEREAI